MQSTDAKHQAVDTFGCNAKYYQSKTQPARPDRHHDRLAWCQRDQGFFHSITLFTITGYVKSTGSADGSSGAKNGFDHDWQLDIIVRPQLKLKRSIIVMSAASTLLHGLGGQKRWNAWPGSPARFRSDEQTWISAPRFARLNMGRVWA